jgi:6-phosphogluconolactonase
MNERTLAFVCSSPGDEPGNGGIVSLAFDSLNGEFMLLSRVGHNGNPTYLAIDEARGRIFVAGETQKSTITSFSFDPESGVLRKISERPTLGQYAAHVNISRSGDSVFVANYSADVATKDGVGAVSYAVDRHGALSSPTWSCGFVGCGPVEGRQQASHPHSTLLDPLERLMIVPDLGTDRLMCFDFDEGESEPQLVERPCIVLPGASGPRHALFSVDGRYLYVVAELASMVLVLDMCAGMKVIQSVSTLPEDFVDSNISADIQITPDGRRLYISNRGHNSLAGFDVDRGSGLLTCLGQTSVGGSWPRSFAIDPTGNFIIVANQRSDELVVFSIDALSGALAEAGRRIRIAQPMCIKMARVGESVA